MNIEIERADYKELESMRELYCAEANTQVVHYSFLGRRLADVYAARMDGEIAGYGAIANKYYEGRVIEFHVLGDFRDRAAAIFSGLIAASNAVGIEAQTNIPLMLAMLQEFGTNIVKEHLLFHDGLTTQLECPDGVFRRRVEADGPGMFGRPEETLSQWVVETRGAIVAAGGFLTHYNPPYGDLFMETAEDARRRGFGSHVVQELKKICYASGKKPAARCNPENIASRKTLEKAGMLVCGEILAAEIKKK
jgi:GNAT superfamily N-acetyltransferase